MEKVKSQPVPRVKPKEPSPEPSVSEDYESPSPPREMEPEKRLEEKPIIQTQAPPSPQKPLVKPLNLRKNPKRKKPDEEDYKETDPNEKEDLYNLFLTNEEYHDGVPAPNFRWRQKHELRTDFGGKEFQNKHQFMERAAIKGN